MGCGNTALAIMGGLGKMGMAVGSAFAGGAGGALGKAGQAASIGQELASGSAPNLGNIAGQLSASNKMGGMSDVGFELEPFKPRKPYFTMDT